MLPLPSRPPRAEPVNTHTLEACFPKCIMGGRGMEASVEKHKKKEEKKQIKKKNDSNRDGVVEQDEKQFRVVGKERGKKLKLTRLKALVL